MNLRQRLGMERRFRPLSNPDFRRLFVSRFVTKLGYWVTFVALFAIFVFESNIGVFEIGTLGVVQIVPNIFASPVLGALTDRFSRKSLLLVAEVVSGVAVLLLVVFQTLVAAYALLFVLGLMTALASPAQKALIPQIIEDDATLSQANALFSSVGSFAQIIGPAVGGALVVVMDPQLMFALDAATYFASAILIYAMGTYTVERDGTAGAFAEIRDGFGHVLRSRTLVFVVGVGLLVFAVLGAFDAMLPLFVREALGEPASAFGYLAGAVAGGSLLSGIVIGGTEELVEVRTGATLAAAGDGLLVVGFGLSSSLLVAGAFAFGIGFCTSAAITYLTTIVQQTAPDDYTGRVFGIFTGVARGGQIGAILVASVAISRVGIETAFSYGGAGLFAVMLAVVAYRLFALGEMPVSPE